MIASLSHKPTLHCVEIERAFLRALQGGCSAPIGHLPAYKIIRFTLPAV
jgi:hydroxymethylbilane synthase